MMPITSAILTWMKKASPTPSTWSGMGPSGACRKILTGVAK